ncbi:hypothetical protein OSH39_10735 [Mycobacterium ulcerans]|uniref:hypothetical protein n=1 Tax=Mycobacterium ulcerans TaxID=1809 RepID=UPI000AF891BA|nr:hypothetical protein [Mycobacterium ulcerans]MEB3905442.1 hypothetical protein [Mycobacterium ulcerans]MEB3909634.1 hypothetical protein [Mycobacterium ulcerans]MEB3919871.1 hypothetical protein [Mycobacterium ulcerans]MEB3923942.1 hypothetical protein [Mycobacterium ulcerans]MEB3928142.1 hypothetical protein [Mycobacterium ulcerans]
MRDAQDGVAGAPAGLRLAVGDPARGLKGFRRSYLEATYAHRVASLMGRRADAVTRCTAASRLPPWPVRIATMPSFSPPGSWAGWRPPTKTPIGSPRP